MYGKPSAHLPWGSTRICAEMLHQFICVHLKNKSTQEKFMLGLLFPFYPKYNLMRVTRSEPPQKPICQTDASWPFRIPEKHSWLQMFATHCCRVGAEIKYETLPVRQVPFRANKIRCPYMQNTWNENIWWSCLFYTSHPANYIFSELLYLCFSYMTFL